MSAVLSLNGLTNKERLFVEHYIGKANLNGAQAARLAGYKDSSSIYVTAHQLLRKTHIQAAIDAKLSQSSMESNEILARLTRQARGDIGDLLNEDGSFDFETARERGLTDQIKEIEITERWIPNGDQPAEKERKVKLKAHDAQAALVHMGKHRKLFTERIEQDVVAVTVAIDPSEAARHITRLFAEAAARKAKAVEAEYRVVDDE